MTIGNVSGTNESSTMQKFDRCINRSVSLMPNTSTQILAANDSRAYAAIINNSSGMITISLGDTPAALKQGILLIAKGSSFEISQSNLFTGKIFAIAGNAAELSFVECTAS